MCRVSWLQALLSRRKIFFAPNLSVIFVANPRVASMLIPVSNLLGGTDATLRLWPSEPLFIDGGSSNFIVRTRCQKALLLFWLLLSRPFRRSPSGEIVIPHARHVFLRALVWAHGGQVALVEEGDLNLDIAQLSIPPRKQRLFLALISGFCGGVNSGRFSAIAQCARGLRERPENSWFWPERAATVYCLGRIKFPREARRVVCSVQSSSIPTIAEGDWIVALTADDSDLLTAQNRDCLKVARNLVPVASSIFFRAHPRSRLTLEDCRALLPEHQIISADPHWLLEACESRNVITSSASIVAIRRVAGLQTIDCSVRSD